MEINEQYLLETLRRMIGIDSVVPNEECLSQFITDELERMGVEVEWDEIAPGRPNVYATADLGPSERYLVFSGHSDTVGVASGWETDPFTMTEKGDRLYGLGIYNMKGGLACSLAAFKSIDRSRGVARKARSSGICRDGGPGGTQHWSQGPIENPARQM